ncbi:MAG: GNAT family N-acetyltransferase [Roseovarius sp.]|nr:GNAT family N-acetyltransferase [Roseovarius sp.]
MKFRQANREDVRDVVRLLSDDFLGRTREHQDMERYLTAFDQMQLEGQNHLIVGEHTDGTIAATYQITFISGLSLSAARRAQIESVRVDSARRGDGVGGLLLGDAEARARAGGCRLVQLTMNTARTDSHRFYTRHGFTPSHTGFKKSLD